MVSREYIVDAAREAGFDLCGVARVRVLEEHKAPFARWLEAGYDSRMGYMSRNFERRFDPAALVEGARTVVVCAVSYKSAASLREPATAAAEHFVCAGPSQMRQPLVSSYALARDYHPTIKGMLERVLEKIREVEPGVSGRAFCDTAPLLEKAWAVEAGIGWQGNNGLVINPRLGSFILLGELVIDAEVESYSESCGVGYVGGESVDKGRDSEERGDRERCGRSLGEGGGGAFGEGRCGDCRLCIDHCPTGAIVASRVIDTNRCISRLTVEAPIENATSPASVGGGRSSRPGLTACASQALAVPSAAANPLPPTPTGATGAQSVPARVEAKRLAGRSVQPVAQHATPPALHGWIFGCDICQRVCPWNRHAPDHTNPAFDPVIDAGELTPEFWRSLTRERFDELFGQTPLARRGYDRIMEKIR